MPPIAVLEQQEAMDGLGSGPTKGQASDLANRCGECASALIEWPLGMPTKREKVIVAMSGGVDSSVAAAMLLEAGYDVTGIYMCLESAGACCSWPGAADAREVAESLGICLYVLNLADEFAPIIDYFLAEYVAGRTPNACIHCNARIKFGWLVRHADSLGARYVATGHHARIIDAAGRRAIARGRSRQKDQSYALFGVAGDSLSRALLPIGELSGKDRVREIARQLGLNVHDKPDSQEICFVPDDDYVAFLLARAPEALRAGLIVDSAGRQVGQHAGYGRYTIGQRRGLGVAGGRPLYVTRIDAGAACVTIGPHEELLSRRLRASRANWHCLPARQFDGVVQIRYNHLGTPGLICATGPDSFEVEFLEPVAAVTPGQAAVVYDGDTLLGGGWIDG